MGSYLTVMVVAIAAVPLGDDVLPVVVTAALQDEAWMLHLRRGMDGALLFSQQANEPIAALYPLAGDRLLCFGRLDLMRDLIPPKTRRRRRPKIRDLPAETASPENSGHSDADEV